jgi:hypothetical protein
METSAQAAISSPALALDMVPSIRAVVRDRKVLFSAGTLALWGTLNLLIWYGAYYANRDAFRAMSRISPLVYVFQYGILGLAGTMLLGAVHGLITRRPETILMESAVLTLVGVWNLAIPWLEAGAFTRGGYPSQPNMGTLIMGAVQVFWGIREGIRYRGMRAWSDAIRTVTRERRREAGRLLTAFFQADEDLLAGRFKAFVEEGGFFARSVRKGYRGQLLDEKALVISKRRDDFLIVSRLEAQGAKYHPRQGTGWIQTDMGVRKFQFGPLSAVVFKRWAGLSPTEADLKRAARKGHAPADVLAIYMKDPSVTLRIAALRCAGGLKKQPLPPAALECLTDADAEVRATAMAACRAAKADGLQPQAVDMLRDPAPAVRKAAAEYLTRFPAASAAETLHGLVQLEEDGAARGQMAKALKACDKAGAKAASVR